MLELSLEKKDKDANAININIKLPNRFNQKEQEALARIFIYFSKYLII